jgi:hypothetical protein
MENQKTRLNLQLRKFVLESRMAWSNSEILKKRKRHNRLAVMLGAVDREGAFGCP